MLITAEPLQSSPALPQVEQALLPDQVYVATISVWAVSLLEAKGRVSFPSDCLSWLQKVADLSGISLVSLTPEIAFLSNRLLGSLSPDEFMQLGYWIREKEMKAWDIQLEKDTKAGKLDFLIDEALEHYENYAYENPPRLHRLSFEY